jgi:hypothetical protein
MAESPTSYHTRAPDAKSPQQVNICMRELIRHREIVGAQLQDCALYETWHGLFDLSITA